MAHRRHLRVAVVARDLPLVADRHDHRQVVDRRDPLLVVDRRHLVGHLSAVDRRDRRLCEGHLLVVDLLDHRRHVGRLCRIDRLWVAGRHHQTLVHQKPQDHVHQDHLQIIKADALHLAALWVVVLTTPAPYAHLQVIAEVTRGKNNFRI